MAKKQAAQETQPGEVAIGENVRAGVEGDYLVIRIKHAYRGGLSASGKTTRVASTLGNVKLPCGITLGLNAYVK